MLKWLKSHLAWAHVGWECENNDRAMARHEGARPLYRDDNYDNVTQIGPQANVPFWLYLITYHVAIQIGWAIRSSVCHFKGHDIEDNSYAGPETGYDSFHCVRCGWSLEHTYY